VIGPGTDARVHGGRGANVLSSRDDLGALDACE